MSEIENRRVKILHITQVSGGIETYLNKIFRHTNKDLFEHILACPKKRTSLIELGKTYNILICPINLRWQINPLFDLIAIFQIIRLVKTTKPSIIHAHSSKAGMVSRLAGLFFNQKVIYTPHAFAYLGASALKKQILLGLERMMRPWSPLLLASSESEKKRAIDNVKFKLNKVRLYPNSIAPLPSKKWNFSKSYKTVMTVGRLVPQKNPLMFVNLCNELAKRRADVQFKMIGVGFDDRLLTAVKKKILEYHLQSKIELIGWMSREELLEEISEADIFVMTSNFESFGYVAAEASALGLPMIATNVDGLNEIVDDGVSGFLVEKEDFKMMCDKINLLLDDSITAEEMGRMGRIRVLEKFNIESNIGILESIYLNIGDF